MTNAIEHADDPQVVAAYMAGRAAGRAAKPLSDCPFDVSLFDPLQLYSAWAIGRKDGLNARYTRRRQHAWNRA